MYKNIEEFLIKRYDPINNRTIVYEREKEVRLTLVLNEIHRILSPIKALDIGCYDGHIGQLMKNKFGKHCMMYGIDVAKNTIALAKKKGIKAKICDVSKGITYRSNMFDFVFAGEIIEHVVDTDFFMQELKRILKPNGILIITTPNTLSLGRRLYYLFGKGIYLEQSFSLPKNAAGHIRYFTFESLKELCDLHNFRTIKVFSDVVNFPGFSNTIIGSTLFAKLFPTFGQSIIVFLHNKK